MPTLAAGTVLTLGGSLVGCASGSSPSSDDPAASADLEQGTESSEHYLDTLFADSLHEGVTPAEPGTAYIEVDGERFEFADVTCSLVDQPDAGRFVVDAGNDTSGEGHVLYLQREIGADIGFNWENEYVQLALMTTSASDALPEQFSNSMAQHSRDEGADPEWDWGNGTAPLVRVVGNQATAVGTVEGIGMADAPLEGEFIAAVTCP